MPTMPTIAQRAQQLLGTAVVSTSPVAGGDVCTATRLRLSDGRSAVVKTRPHPPDGFFATEARGLERIAETGTVAVPEVLAHDADCLILAWVEPGRASVDAAEDLGRSLAALHATGTDGFGDSQDGFIGSLPLPNAAPRADAGSWAEFYATRRVLPYLKLASDRAQIEPSDADSIDRVLHRLVELAGPAEPPALLHGDLWSGNVVWAREGAEHGACAHLIDAASVHGGHRETDLAMLALFGLPNLPRLMQAYQEATPLADGWADRVALHQLFPLLVHTCLFGASYGARAGAAARSYL